MGAEFVILSLTPLLIGSLSALACALPGNFLILRRQALIGDAISHVVLPGIVVAFLITGTVGSLPMLAGAAAAAVVAVALIEAIKRLGRIEPGPAMGGFHSAVEDVDELRSVRLVGVATHRWFIDADLFTSGGDQIFEFLADQW